MGRQLKHSHLTAMLRLVLFMCLMPFAPTGHAQLFKPQSLRMQVSVRVIDEQGNPVPFVTVWQTRSPCRRITSGRIPLERLQREFEDCPTADDILTLAKRLENSRDYFVSDFTRRPTVGLRHAGVVGPDGILHLRETASSPKGGLGEPGVPRVRVSLGFLKFGYEPAGFDIVLTPEQLKFKKVVTLKAIESQLRPPNTLRGEFDRIRYQVSKLTEMHQAPDRGSAMAQFGLLLEDVAKRAEEAGDRELAAIALTHRRFMPTVLYSGEGASRTAVGYSNEGSPRDNHFLTRAHQLDPDNAYWFRFNAEWGRLHSLVYRTDLSKQQIIEAHGADIDAFAQLLARNERSLWPADYVKLCQYFIQLNQLQRAYEWARRLYDQDPKIPENRYCFARVFSGMREQRLPIPADWVFPP